ncbi:MAG: hypothetical protein GEV05_15885 [Betaproteobacteria bacterium]|nr:hypothetical protein [Betaproteobacteria bacterium]
MEKLSVVTGIAAPMPMPNINTDAISPMAAGRSTSADLGKLLFANWRYGLDGAELPEFAASCRAPKVGRAGSACRPSGARRCSKAWTRST